jgi:hypothetical protein
MKQKHPHPVIGQKFGKWTIKEEKINKSYKRKYLCECECKETITWVSKYDLIYNKSSKCLKCAGKETSKRIFTDLTGQKINNWTVIKRLGVAKKSRTPLWLCLCDCGKEVEVRASNLLNNTSKRCGKCRFFEDISFSKWSQIKKGAESRNIDFNITIEEAWDLFIKQDKKCALTGIKLVMHEKRSKNIEITASLDRIDSNIGYSKENCQWVHKTINCVKGKLSNKEFISLCYDICSQHKNENYNWENVDMKKTKKERRKRKKNNESIS